MADVTIEPRPNTQQIKPLAVADGDYLPGFSGNWTAHLELSDLVEPPTGKITLTWLGRALSGQVLRGGRSTAGRVFVYVAGGNGDLGAPIPPVLPAKAYRNVQVRVVLADIMVASGESLSSTSEASIMARSLATWPRRNDTACALLDDLARELGVIWRVLPDGSIYFGSNTFSETVSAQPLQQLDDQDPAYATGLYVPHSFGPLPGESYEGRRVGAAHYTISPEGPFVQLWFLDAATHDLDGGNLRRSLAELIKETVRIDWYGTYPGKVVTQRADGTLDVQFDSRLIPPLPSVRYRTFAPGARLSVASGSRVDVTFDNADPLAPVAHLFDPGSAQLGAARETDPVDPTALFTTWIQQVQVALNAIAGGSVTPFTGPHFGTISGASTKVFIP